MVFKGKKANELGASGVKAGDAKAEPLSGAAIKTPDPAEDAVFKRLERVHLNCVENRTYACSDLL